MCLHRVLKWKYHFSYGQLKFEAPLDFLKNNTIYAVCRRSLQFGPHRNGLDPEKKHIFGMLENRFQKIFQSVGNIG